MHEAKHESAQSAMREDALEQRLGECGALVVQLQAALKSAEERAAIADTQLGERGALVGQVHAGLKKSILIKLVLACARAVR